MKRILYILLLSASFHVYCFGQAVGSWKSYSAYQTTTAVVETYTNVFAVANGSLYSYGKEDSNVRTYAKTIDGLSDSQISNIGYNTDAHVLLIIYENGNIDIWNEKAIYNLPHLMSNTTIQDKTVNDIYFYKEYAYASTQFGILVINLNKQEIKDTYRLDHPVYSTCIFGENIYAATSKGVLEASLNSNLLDKANWHPYEIAWPEADTETDIRFISPFQNVLCFWQQDKGIYYKDAGGDIKTVYENSSIRKVVSCNDKLFALINNETVMINTLTSRQRLNTGTINDISSLKENIYWTASGNDMLKGLRKKDNVNEYEWFVSDIRINSPLRNYADYLSFHGRKLMVAGGGRWTDASQRTGTVMFYENNEWTNVDDRKVNSYYGYRDATSIAIDPRDETHFFVSTWNGGLFEFKGSDDNYVRYTKNNSILESTRDNNNDVRIDGLMFDDNNNLWMTNSEVKNAGIKVITADGKWVAYNSSLYSSLNNLFLIDKIYQTKHPVNKNYKWVNIVRSDKDVANGFLVFDDNNTVEDPTDDKTRHIKKFYSTSGAIDASTYYCMAEDRNGQIWIGTNLGPVYLANGGSVLDNTNNVLAHRVIRSDDDGASYFLDGENIRAIAVDEGNRKWLGTENNGIYIVSDDATETIHHFKTENSPLPSNRITSIAIDHNTGEAFIGTDKGIVSYIGGATQGEDSYSNVYAFPNPVRPEFMDQVTITGLMEDSNIKITDTNGNLIIQGTSWGGQFTWDCRNKSGKRVSTGVYLVFASSSDGGENEVTKIMIIK